MLTALALVTMTAQPVTLAMPGLNAVNINPSESEYYADTLCEDLNGLKLKVSTARDIATVLGVQRQKELLGCTESGCFTELAGALGADGIVVGDVGKIGDEYALNVKVLKPDGAVLALFNARIDKAEHVRDTLNDAARSLAHQLAQVLSRPELEPPPLTPVVAAKPSRRIWAIAPAVVAVVGFGIGTGLQLGASDQYSALMSATFDKAARDARDSGKGMELGGNIALTVGAVALVAAVVWFIIGGGDP